MATLAALTGGAFAQDPIPVQENFAIYKYTESSRGKFMSSQSTQSDVDEYGNPIHVLEDGGVERTSNKARSYIVLNLDNGEFQRVTYSSDIEIDGAGRRVRVKEYRTEFSDYRPESFFQTAFGTENNYMSLSMWGTGFGQNYYFDGDVFGGDRESAVSSDTLVGRVRLHRAGLGASRVEIIAPAKFTGKTSSEHETFRQATGLTRRSFDNGTQSMVLQKGLTARALADGAATIEDAMVFITEYLRGKGYIDHEAHDVE